MVIFWFRRDLRLEDNAALYYALKKHKEVQPIFIFDTDILSKLSNTQDPRITFIHDALTKLQDQLNELGSNLKVFYGRPKDVFQELIQNGLSAVYSNRDYEPQAILRDKEIFEMCQGQDIAFISKKDQVIFDRDEVLKDNGEPYTVFTPYSKKWKVLINDFQKKSYPNQHYFQHFKKTQKVNIISIEQLGFKVCRLTDANPEIDLSVIRTYDQTRDIPSIKGTSRLSVHLRFGTVSIRELVRIAEKNNAKWLDELIWRDFYQMILYHFPHTVDQSFKPKYDLIQWENNEAQFDAWCKGRTGYPIVDAGMRELNTTGYMHNRVRMIVASFLTKHLLIDWRWGERYFADKLMDFDLASNIGGWQWAAGSGCDAAPYFRVFNPYLQTEKFDPDLKYIKRWIPELNQHSYPEPIVDHKFARTRALDRYKNALQD